MLVNMRVPDVSCLVATTVLNTKISEVENKILDTSNLVTKTVLNTKIGEVENKIADNFKHITSQKFNKLTPDNFAAILKLADLVKNIGFDNKLTSFNRQITSNKKKHLEEKKKLNNLITKDYNFLLGRIYFTSNYEFQNTFVYQPVLDTLKF